MCDPDPHAISWAREDWALAFVMLGAHGYRPQLTADALVAYRPDGVTITITGQDGRLPSARYDAALTVTLRDAEGLELQAETIRFDHDRQLVQAVVGRFADYLPWPAASGRLHSRLPPADELDRLMLATAFAAYRLELDALAARGIHAYLEHSGFGMRIYCDISRSLLLDISIEDEGVPPAGPDDGDWSCSSLAPTATRPSSPSTAWMTVARTPTPSPTPSRTGSAESSRRTHLPAPRVHKTHAGTPRYQHG